jgi:hypothetical protein
MVLLFVIEEIAKQASHRPAFLASSPVILTAICPSTGTTGSECMSNQWGDPKSGKHAQNNKPDRDRRKKMRANSCAASADNWAMGERE